MQKRAVNPCERGSEPQRARRNREDDFVAGRVFWVNGSRFGCTVGIPVGSPLGATDPRAQHAYPCRRLFEPRRTRSYAEDDDVVGRAFWVKTFSQPG